MLVHEDVNSKLLEHSTWKEHSVRFNLGTRRIWYLIEECHGQFRGYFRLHPNKNAVWWILWCPGIPALESKWSNFEVYPLFNWEEVGFFKECCDRIVFLKDCQPNSKRPREFSVIDTFLSVPFGSLYNYEYIPYRT